MFTVNLQRTACKQNSLENNTKVHDKKDLIFIWLRKNKI